jgi:hypothetical protein
MVLLASIAPTKAEAKAGDLPPSDHLNVYVLDDRGSTLAHKYTIPELENLVDMTGEYYSSVDQMPARVLTIATGVSIDALVSDVSSKESNFGILSFDKIEFRASADGWNRTYTYNEIYNSEMYYYGRLFDTNTFQPTSGSNWTIDADDVINKGSKWAVTPMLAIYSVQGRIPAADGGYDTVSDAEYAFGGGDLSSLRDGSLRLCLGQTEADLRNFNHNFCAIFSVRANVNLVKEGLVK